MKKHDIESVLTKCIDDVTACQGDIYAMGKLYKLNITEQDKFYNSCLLAMINNRETELKYNDGTGAIYF